MNFTQYWYESLCSIVRFDRAVVAAQKCGADAFIEMSAHPSLLYPLIELVGDDSAVILGSGHRDGPITDVLSANIAAAATADPGYPWVDTLPADVRRRYADFRMPRCGRCTYGSRRSPPRSPTEQPADRRRRGLAAGRRADTGTATRCGIAIFGDRR